MLDRRAAQQHQRTWHRRHQPVRQRVPPARATQQAQQQQQIQQQVAPAQQAQAQQAPVQQQQPRKAQQPHSPPLSPKEQQLLQQVMNYRYEVELPEGQLVISALRVEWLQRTGDLLLEAFVDSSQNIGAYRRYVRRNIGNYLELHAKMPPHAVVLTAVLRQRVTVGGEAELLLESLDPSSSASSSSSSSSSSSTSSSAGSSAVAPPPPWMEWLGWLVQPNAPAVNDSSSAQPPRAAADSAAASSSSTGQPLQAPPPSNAGDGSAATMGGLVRSALQQLSSTLGLPRRPGAQVRVVEQLVGVGEVSFRDSTRSSYLTLNPPKRCAYACNMAVSSAWRRRGVASHVLTAIEDLAALAGEEELFLHLRMKDRGTAGPLYMKAGFAEAKRDCWLLLLIGQEPRSLMRKQLAPWRQLAGSVHLPAPQAQAGAAGSREPQVPAGPPPQPAAVPAASPAA